MSKSLVPDELWAIVEPLMPPFTPRAQGGGTTPADPRAVFAAIVYVLTSGCAWGLLPSWVGVIYKTVQRRFGQWTDAGLWRRIHVAVLDELGARGDLDWSRAILDAASVRARIGEPDRAEPGGSRQARLEDPPAVRRGRPAPVVGVAAAHAHDSVMFVPLLDGIPAIRARRGPRRRRPGKVHADKGYDAAELRAYCRRLGIASRIARRGIESSERLGASGGRSNEPSRGRSPSGAWPSDTSARHGYSPHCSPTPPR